MSWLCRGTIGNPPSSGPDYLHPYRDMAARVGQRFEALLWSSRQTQAARFQAAIDMIDLTGRTVLDAGCGHADFAQFMDRRGVEYGRYIGLEALPEMLAEARRRNPPRAEFIQADFVADPRAFDAPRPAPQIIVFSGSLNTLDQEAALPVLERAWRACSQALVFNFLCRPRAYDEGRLRGSPVRKFDAAAMVAWAIDRTPLVAFRQDYLEGTDGTIVMRVG